MIIKNVKTILFASLIAAMVLPFATVDFAEAKKDDSIKSDFDLMNEAEKIEKTEKNIRYDKDGNNKDSIKNSDQKRHEDIVKELNSRGIFHRSQDQPLLLDQYKVDSISSEHNPTHQTVDVFLTSPVSSVETMDYVCCDGTHDKKLSIKAGMEWNSPHFPWWEHRVESNWSPFVNDHIVSETQIGSSENNVRPYVTVRADHAVTWSTFQISSLITVLDQHGEYISLEPLTPHPYDGVYFATKATENTGNLGFHPLLPAAARHTTALQIFSIE